MTPIDRMNPMGYPLPKRFVFISTNVRQNFRSYYAAAIATNRPTHGLFNASTGARVVVLRGFSWSGYAASPTITFSAVQGQVGSHLGTEFPTWAGERAPEADHTYVDTTTVYPPSILAGATQTAFFLSVSGSPLLILPPGWSVVAQPSVAAGTVIFQWYWEELSIEDPMLGSVIG